MDLHLNLRDAPGRSLRSRTEHALRAAVRRLPQGTRLPPTRALAAQLGVSRGVVVEAYAQLAAEGYLLTRRGGGTFVAASRRRPSPPHRRLPARARRATTCGRRCPRSTARSGRRGRARSAVRCGRPPTRGSATPTRAASRNCGPRWPSRSRAAAASRRPPATCS